MVFGTFDFLHKGHLNFFAQARRLAKRPFLIVSVARGGNVRRIKKQAPRHSEAERFLAVRKCPLVDRVVLGGQKNFLPHILKQKPAIIALGYDQKAYVKDLRNILAKKRIAIKIKRLKSYRAKVYKSSLVAKRLGLTD